MDGEFKMKTLPIAARIEPINTNTGLLSSIMTLNQTPHITNADPMVHPTFMPNLSRIQLAGTVLIGWRMGKTKTKNVTVTNLKLKALVTRLLRLAKA
jgi:hypothetical protein